MKNATRLAFAISLILAVAPRPTEPTRDWAFLQKSMSFQQKATEDILGRFLYMKLEGLA